MILIKMLFEYVVCEMDLLVTCISVTVKGRYASLQLTIKYVTHGVCASIVYQEPES